MAVTFVNKWQGQINNSTTVGVTAPDAIQDGDLLLVCFTNHNTMTYTAPDGTWTQLISQTANAALVVFSKLASSEPASWTFTASAAQKTLIIALAYRGVDQTTPVDVYGSTAYATSDTTVRGHSRTTTVADALVVWVGGWYVTGGVMTAAPSGFTDRATEVYTSIAYMYAGDKLFASAGATGDQDLTVTSAVIYKRAGLIAVAPVSGPAAPVLSASQVASDIVLNWT